MKTALLRIDFPVFAVSGLLPPLGILVVPLGHADIFELYAGHTGFVPPGLVCSRFLRKLGLPDRTVRCL